MKSLRIALFMMLALLLVAPVASAKDEKIGYVNLSTLFDEYHKTKEYDVVLEKKASDFEKVRNEKIEAIRQKQSQLGLLAEDKKAALEEEIETMKTDLLEYDQQNKTDLTKERNEKIREILLEIEEVVSTYAKKENYAMIVNDRILIFGQETLDLTDEILETLNAGK